MSTFQTIMNNITKKLQENQNKKAKYLDKKYIHAFFSEILETENTYNFYKSLKLRLEKANTNSQNIFNHELDKEGCLKVYQFLIDNYKDKLLQNLYTDSSTSQMANAIGSSQREFASHTVQHQEYFWKKLLP